MKTTAKMALVAATLISTATVATTAHAGEERGKCHGVNSCKGHTECSTAESVCQGSNSCKGKGWLPMKKPACESKGGKFEKAEEGFMIK